MKRLNLIIVPESSNCDIGDFHDIAERIRKLAGDIRVHVVKRRYLWWRQLGFLFKPSLYVAFYEARSFQPLRGASLHGKSIAKSEQYLRMEDAGFDTLPWQVIAADKQYEKADWGDRVIIKPDRGREGQGVRLVRPEDIRQQMASQNGRDNLIQKFVDTGRHPNYFRALTLFGDILYLRKTTNLGTDIDACRAEDLPDPVANASQGSTELVDDREIIEFAKALATRAFADIPLLGQDIVRERSTGRLYCLEVNPYGSTWHFSTVAGKKLQQRDKIDYRSQYGAFDVAAKVLIEKTRLLAR